MHKAIMTTAMAAVLAWTMVPAQALTLAPGTARLALPSAEGGLVHTVQLREERRDVRRAQREVRRERRDVRRADTRRERRLERRELRDARRDLRRERRELRAERRYYVRDGRRYYRKPVTGAEIFAGTVGAIIGGAIAASQNENAIAYCESRYRSYDRRTGTYLGYDGKRHPCP